MYAVLPEWQPSPGKALFETDTGQTSFGTLRDRLERLEASLTELQEESESDFKRANLHQIYYMPRLQPKNAAFVRDSMPDV